MQNCLPTTTTTITTTTKVPNVTQQQNGLFVLRHILWRAPRQFPEFSTILTKISKGRNRLNV